MENEQSEVFIVPHTHWDREWYLPFQNFRVQLVNLVDKLLEITKQRDYFFMLDGQTIVLEDYLEIRPEKKDELMSLIRKGQIAVGPWYLLPDEWLIGQESFIRNLEISFDLAKEFNIPLMEIGYLPDQFGHSRAIPQILSNLTSFKAAVIWRGVGPEIITVPFKWKSDFHSHDSILGVYMPKGYGNAADLPENDKDLKDTILEKIEELKPFSPVPVYLLMYGTDHQFPHPNMNILAKLVQIENTEINFSLLHNFVDELQDKLQQTDFIIPEYSGEFRSSVRAHLLQDTYSTRMWIKQWNQKIEDLLVHYVEPLTTFLWLFNNYEYPTSYLNLAWKWLLKNQTHDGICGCSIDQVHEEMKSRFHWSESIGESQLNELKEEIDQLETEDAESKVYVFNPTNNSDKLSYFEFTTSAKKSIVGLQDSLGSNYLVQALSSSEEILFENTFSPIVLKTAFRLLPGRKILDYYLNEVHLSDNINPEIYDVTLLCGRVPLGDFDVDEFKKQAAEMIKSKKYKKYHIKATLGSKQTYGVLAPLKGWNFNEFKILENMDQIVNDAIFLTSKNKISTTFYELKFNSDGTFNYLDKRTNTEFIQLHKFEDYGDKGDEYTFGRIGPDQVKIKKVKRNLIVKGPLFCEIEQEILVELLEELNENRDERIGSVTIPIKTVFRFYRDLARIDIKTTLTNYSKDHRLRICFDLPYSSLETITSTQFGVVKRKSDPIGDESYEEQPSGIQAQKRFIRIEDNKSDLAFTLINKGLPEVELANNNRLALTLLRCVGFLSRADYEERPMHAGPFLETPGAQEIGEKYTFEYSLSIHSKELPLHDSDNLSESFCLKPKSMLVKNNELHSKLSESILHIVNPWIRISSLRKRNDKLCVTFYNLSSETETTIVQVNSKFNKFEHAKIDGKILFKDEIRDNQLELNFKPYEIKMCYFS